MSESRSSGSQAIPSVRSIALPVEHGGWGFTLEPVLLGLLVAASASTWELGVAALAVFLGRRPLKLTLTDMSRRRWLPRTRIAALFAALYGTLALAGVAGAMVTADPRFMVAYLVAIPVALVALYLDTKTKSRTLVAELAGATAMGSTVAAMALADGWAYPQAFGLWLVLIGRGVTTITLVRAQIRRVHDRPTGEVTVYVVAALTLTVMVILAAADVVPWLGAAAICAILLLEYVSLTRPPVAARVVGWTQIATGLAVVLLTAIGVWIGL